MRLEPSDPDIETVVTRINRGDLDLQPEFQRGEVWSRQKKQRLIDSILRDWHIPPIHVIELRESRRQQVLDGQQRLAAIRDFVRGEFPIDGKVEPFDAGVVRLSGLRFAALPDDVRRRFNQFTLRIFRIVDYRPEEPAELFFRLNQPSSLTAAEQRNAFFGPVRPQIKALVSRMVERGLDRKVLGFSNARMAYDDLLARLCLTVTRGTLAEKLTASDLVDLYRSEETLAPNTLDKLNESIDLFSMATAYIVGPTALNKATAFSWFIFAIRANSSLGVQLDGQVFGAFLSWFEAQRIYAEGETFEKLEAKYLTQDVLSIYSDRSASRVADVSSVMLRDAILWMGFEDFASTPGWVGKISIPGRVRNILRQAYENEGSPFVDDSFARSLLEAGWGELQ